MHSIFCVRGAGITSASDYCMNVHSQVKNIHEAHAGNTPSSLEAHADTRSALDTGN
jgi:hypothetical protein